MMSFGSFLEHAFAPVVNVGEALVHGDILGGQYQASPSDWMKTAAVAAAPFAIGAALPALGGAFGAEAGAGALGAAELGGTELAAGEGFAPGAGWLAESGISASPEALTGFAADTSGLYGGAEATNLGESVLTGGFDPFAGAGGYAAGPGDAFAQATGETVPGLEGMTGGMGGAGWNAPVASGALPDTTLDTIATGTATGVPPTNISPTAFGGGAIPSSPANPTAGTSFLGNLGGQVMRNPMGALGVGAGLVGLGSALWRGNQTSANEQAIANTAGTLQAQYGPLVAESRQLRSYMENNNLPGPLQEQVRTMVASAKARAIANAAKNGQSTDPTRNTSLATDLTSIDNQSLITAGQLQKELFIAGNALLKSGMESADLSSKLYNILAGFDRQNQKDITDAITKFAAALGSAGGGGTQKYSLNPVA